MLNACAMTACLPTATTPPAPPPRHVDAALHITFVPHQTSFLLAYNKSTLPVLELRGTNRLTASLLLSCAQPELVEVCDASIVWVSVHSACPRQAPPPPPPCVMQAVSIEFSAAHSGELVTERQSLPLSAWDRVRVADQEMFVLRDLASCVSFLRGLPSKERKKAVCLSTCISLRDGNVVQQTVATPMFIRTNLVAKSSLVWMPHDWALAPEDMRVSNWANPDALRRLHNLARFQVGLSSLPCTGGAASQASANKKRRHARSVPTRRRLSAVPVASPTNELVSAAIVAGARRITRAYAAHTSKAAGMSDQASGVSVSEEETLCDMLALGGGGGIIMPLTPDLPLSTSALLELGDDDDSVLEMAVSSMDDAAPPLLMMDDLAHFIAF